jgi:lipopolysaccharide export system ATP-binding protein
LSNAEQTTINSAELSSLTAKPASPPETPAPGAFLVEAINVGPQTLYASGLKKTYRGRCVVNNVAIEVHRGEVVGLLGPNGAGKTTSFYMIVGLEQPDQGKIQLGTQDVTSLPMYLRARRGISYLPQEPSVFRKLTVEKNVLAILETLQLSRKQRQVHVRHTKGYALSGGERRRTEIARCLTTKPYFLLLDEPFAGIDPIAVTDIQQIIRRLKASGIGVLITDHNVRETLAITDRAYIINNGAIFRTGTPTELTADPEVRKIYLGENFRL